MDTSQYTLKQIAQFWLKVNIQSLDECWLWLGNPQKSGYGRLSINNHHYLAHRVAYALHNGSFPDELFVLHSCDNRLCCNPQHLFLGTHLDNMRDMSDKGRHHDTKGDKHPQRKLTSQDILSIRTRYINGDKQIDLSKEYGVRQSTISSIIRGHIWKHLT